MDMNDLKTAKRKLFVGLVCAAVVVIAGAFTSQAVAQDYTKAQTLLFATPHLKTIVSKSELHYDISQSGSLTHKIKDKIVLSITAVNADGGKDIEPQFLSGKKQKKYEGVQGFQGNALLLYFLEWDIDKMGDNRTMNHHKIHRQFFQHVLRNAFSKDAKADTTTVTYKGDKLKAQRIKMKPWASRENDPRYMHLWNKEYEFLLADVPGGIYRIKTEIPGKEPNEQPKERTEITFSSITPADAYSKN